MGPLIRPPPDSPGPASTSSGASLSPRTTFRPGSPEPLGVPPHKRVRTGYEQHYAPTVSGQRSPLAPTSDSARPGIAMGMGMGMGMGAGAGAGTGAGTGSGTGTGMGAVGVSWPPPPPELPRIHEEVLMRAWQTDPYVSDPQSVTATIASFFVHLDYTALRFLPETAFTAWIQSSAAAHHRKSPEDLMLVYSILALGLALSGGPKHIAFEYAQVGRYASERAALSIQLVQARLALALYYLSASRLRDANDMSSAASWAATCLQLNIEMDQARDATLTDFPYGLARQGYAECRRRTFWACFLVERLNGLFPNRPTILQTEDIFLRLPSDSKSFEDQIEAAAPAFEPHFSASYVQHHHHHHHHGMGITGYLVRIVAIWGDIMTCIYRIAHRGAYYEFDYCKFHHDTMARLEDWRMSLPPLLASYGPSPAGLGQDEAPSFMAMHLIYHLAVIKLHRHTHTRFLTASLSREYAAVAREHSWRLLDLWSGMAADNNSVARAGGFHPFASSALLEAADVLTAEGSCAELPRLHANLVRARAAISAASTAWAEAQVHGMALDHRLDRLASIRDRGSETESPGPGIRLFLVREDEDGDSNSNSGNGTARTGERGLSAGRCWQLMEPIESRFPRDMDCIYGGRGPLPPSPPPLF